MRIETGKKAFVLCFVALICTGELHADDEAIATIEKLGGTVRQIAQDTEDKEAAFHLSGTELTDDGLVHLKAVDNLVWLNLRGTKITDAGLAHLAELQDLTRLHLEKTAIADEGLQHLANLENLEYLNLYGTKVTDQGLEHLKNLKNLKKLYVWETEVTEDGADALIAALPELYINRGADAEPGPPTKALAMGRFVKIRLEGEKKILQLAEVQLIETATGKELQLEGKASQSSDHDEAVAGRANDGNAENAYQEGSVSHTSEETNPWWLLEFPEPQDIGKIVIHNRGDCCGDRLQGAIIEVFDNSLSIVFTGKVEEATDGSVTEFVAE